MSKIEEYLKKIQKDDSLRIIVSVDERHLKTLGQRALEEAKKATVGRVTAYRHQPHFQGGEYHGHCDLPNGCQVSWTLTGKRLHPNKFPADNQIPKNAKLAVAKALGISVDLLEAFVAYDKIEDEDIILFELKAETKAARLLREISSINDKKNTSKA